MWDTVGSEYGWSFSTQVVDVCLCLSCVAKAPASESVHNHLFYESTWTHITFTHLMSCSHHCLYSWSSMAGNCLETFDMHVNNSLQNLMFWATVLPLALGIFLVSQWWRVCISQSCAPWNSSAWQAEEAKRKEKERILRIEQERREANMWHTV